MSCNHPGYRWPNCAQCRASVYGAASMGARFALLSAAMAPFLWTLDDGAMASAFISCALMAASRLFSDSQAVHQAVFTCCERFHAIQQHCRIVANVPRTNAPAYLHTVARVAMLIIIVIAQQQLVQVSDYWLLVYSFFFSLLVLCLNLPVC